MRVPQKIDLVVRLVGAAALAWALWLYLSGRLFPFGWP